MTPAELAVLSAELGNDPLALGYAARLPEAPGHVVDLINAPNFSMIKTRYVTARTILAECTDGAAILDALQTAAASVSAVKWMMTFLQQDSGMDAGHPKTQQNISDLATVGLLSAPYAAELKAIAIQSASRADVLGLPPVTINDLVAAGIVK